ncbi:hypothetical protein B2K_18480 [Paenibacillus mucilaginosus K02]|uniref:Uncharacterized protein n=1 Tax=Paenibacillus mucilaginosus K02 TaxID=997761 RepID=I0BJY7_9BACL|nr:hypothetical protein B2K_18480 [Paenibacillus mucilaginosus K02]
MLFNTVRNGTLGSTGPASDGHVLVQRKGQWSGDRGYSSKDRIYCSWKGGTKNEPPSIKEGSQGVRINLEIIKLRELVIGSQSSLAMREWACGKMRVIALKVIRIVDKPLPFAGLLTRTWMAAVAFFFSRRIR